MTVYHSRPRGARDDIDRLVDLYHRAGLQSVEQFLSGAREVVAIAGDGGFLVATADDEPARHDLIAELLEFVRKHASGGQNNV
jgi:hypothetical protein